MEKKNCYWVDIIKIIGLLLVSYGHIVLFGTYGKESFRIFPKGYLLESLIPQQVHSLWRFDAFFYNHIKTESANIGVILFFLMSGFFLPYLQGKYNQDESPRLLYSRVLKFYPCTFICVALCGLLMFFWQGMIFPFKDYLGTALLCGTFIPHTTIMGVSWFLFVLIYVYIVSSIFKQFTLYNLKYVYLICFLICILSFVFKKTPLQGIFDRLLYASRYSGIVFLGSVLYLLKDKKIISKVSIFIFYFFITFVLVKAGETVLNTKSSYANIYSYIEVGCIIFAVRLIDYFFPGLFESFARGGGVLFFRRVFMPFYLLHVHFGFASLYFLKKTGMNATLMVIVTYIIVFALSFAVGMIVEKIYNCSLYKLILRKVEEN